MSAARLTREEILIYGSLRCIDALNKRHVDVAMQHVVALLLIAHILFHMIHALDPRKTRTYPKRGLFEPSDSFTRFKIGFKTVKFHYSDYCLLRRTGDKIPMSLRGKRERARTMQKERE